MFKLRIPPNCYNFKFFRLRYCSQEVRVRFAPSPTGHLHLGGLRTALYNFLYAKGRDGKFLLRIEDTDRTRAVDGAREQLQNDLNWAGIYIDEGPNVGGRYGPYVQSQRLNIYREQAGDFLDNGSAYYCFCSSKRLDLLRLEAVRARQIPKYDNRCRHLTREDVQKKLDGNQAHCVRFKLTSGSHTFEDVIYGTVAYDVASNEGDPVIMKSDGYPTYHFANVVDDRFMKVSHVFRGVEWQVSTTKHIMMYKAFDWDPPVYGHLPLLLNSDGTKLSKRQGDIQILHYRKSGILPLALINFVTHSGGGFAKDLERGLKPKSYTMDVLARQFDMNKVKSHSGKLFLERLAEFNRLELERQLQNEDDLKVLVVRVRKIIEGKFPDRVTDNSLNLNEQYIKSVLFWASNRIDYLTDLVSSRLAFLWVTPKNWEIKNATEAEVIERLKEGLKLHEIFNKDDLKVFFKEFCVQNNVKFSNLMQSLRCVLSGLKEGPSVAEMMEILGKENTLARLQTYVKKGQI